MPHLQLDVHNHYSAETKRNLAQRFGSLYATIMQTTPDIVDVTIRELEGGVWHCGKDGQQPVPAAVLSLDIRAGRPPEQRARLADALHQACVEILRLDPEHVAAEFTQHAGNEIYRKAWVDGRLVGRLAVDWSPSETGKSVIDSLREESLAAR
jgi:phenylpyruvate tautomerase PptA (4-oxalocrotonate tautomerase family)